jgi:hypothetical protein
VPTFASANGSQISDFFSNQALKANGISNTDAGLVKQEGVAQNRVNKIQDFQQQSGGAINNLTETNINEQQANLQAGFGQAVNEFSKTLQEINLKDFSEAVGGFGVAAMDHAKALEAFGQPANELASALNQFPRSIDITQNGTVQVILNGAEVMAKMPDVIREIANKAIEDKLGEQLPKLLRAIPA